MSLYQSSVLKKHLKQQDKEAVAKAYKKFSKHFHNPKIQENIRNSKEEQYQEGFLRELFVDVLGYTLNPQPNYNLTTELKNEKGSKKVDGAILKDGNALGVIELKGTDTKDLEKVRQQAFDYKANQSSCVYVVTSNFEKLRFYINNAVEFEEFDLFTINEQRFEVLYLSLAAENILNNIPLSIKEASVVEQENITKKFYADYSLFKRELFRDLVKKNLRNDVFRNVLAAEETAKADKNIKLTLFKKSQKLIDRFLFIFFAEDRGLLPPNSTHKILEDWNKLKDMDAIVPLYDRFKLYFNYLDTGRKGTDGKAEIFAYNGGLFKPDNTLDSLVLDDELLYKHTKKLSEYDFESQVDVNILGHIFENSLNEIESVNAEIEGTDFDKQKTKRKKDGVFYTPKYITKYIVDNTVGKLCQEKRAELGIIDEEFTVKRQKETKRLLLEKLDTYRTWLLELTICDPACGSGAFLNQALDFLIKEHESVDELQAALLGGAIVFQEIENTILEKNIYGVDLNEESVEIAKLSLWLRTAQPRRKLNDLNNNIKCGNSLIDSKEVAGGKAFKWEEKFPEVFAKGGFDVVIGNPPYGAYLTPSQVEYFRKKYNTVIGHSEVYYLFTELGNEQLLKNEGILGFIIPNAWLSNKYASALRRYLLENTWINILINFNQKIIFEDANVETSILIIKKTKNRGVTLVGQELEFLYEYEQEEWMNNQNYLMSFAPNKVVNQIVQKLNIGEKRLEDCLDISNGIKPYQANYGLNLDGLPLTVEDVKNKIYHSPIKLNELYKKEIKGKGVGRYTLNWEENYVKWGKWLMSPKAVHYFEQPKILLRQIISDYFYAVIDDQKYYADQSLYICTNYTGRNENLEFYTALLNSKLYGFYFRKFYSEEDDLFPKIKVNELKNLPIKICSAEIQNKLSEKAISITESFENMINCKGKFIVYLKSQFRLEAISKKLQSWHELSFSDFIKELNKAIKAAGGTPLIKLQEMEWMEVFETKKKEALELKAEIDKTDKEIDRMVYELYGLSEEEIAIVENS